MQANNPTANLVCSVLFPTFEYLLLASGWARPLAEEWIDSPFFSLAASGLSRDNTVTGKITPKWDWVSYEHVHQLMQLWLCQLHILMSLPPTFPNSLSYVVPFESIFRVIRQVVESCTSPIDPYCSGLNHRLLNDTDDDASVPGLISASKSDEPDNSQAVAQLAKTIMDQTTLFLAKLVSTSETPANMLRSQLCDVALKPLLMGFLAESAEARQLCLSCVLTLIEKVPTFIDRITSEAVQISAAIQPSTAPELASEPQTDSQPLEEPVTKTTSELTDLSDIVNDNSEKISRKKPSKSHRRKHKHASSKEDAHAHKEMLTKPYPSPSFWPKLSFWHTVQLRLWVALCDPSSEVALTARKIWDTLGLQVACELPLSPDAQANGFIARLRDTPGNNLLMNPMSLADRLLLESTRPVISVQRATADAFAICLLSRSPDEVGTCLSELIQLYQVMLQREPAIKDSIGRILAPESPDRWRERFGLALSLASLPEAFNPSEAELKSLRKGLALLDTRADAVPNESSDQVAPQTVEPERNTRADPWLINLFRFLVPDGLNDPNPAVQSEMLQAGLRAVAIYGKMHFSQLLPILESFLNKAPNVAELDSVRQSVLILTGSLSQHLSPDDPKIWNVFSRLISTLNFPSDLVQQAVEDCLASLVAKLSEEQRTKAINRLMATLLGSPHYAERHGAAHGIAGIARGLGIMTLKHYGIIEKLLPALEDAKSSKHREGALLAIERLCLGMGRLFEPYIIRLISGLLSSFGDTSANVREAATNTARAIMSKLSAHGVRLVLPALLKAIDNEQSWRTKAHSVELLGAMTHCAPKQLSACLPQIVPRLLEVLVTSQEQLKDAGVRALKEIGSVIRNPEVQVLVPLLTKCLQDPLADKMPCLLALRDTCFVHVLDAPSLAFILPLIKRALDDRSTEARKTAAQIFSNFHSLARKEDLQPYVADILPPLKSCLLDAVPEIRSVAAAALGALVRGMGESCFNEILPWLISTLASETSSVDRSGAAQGLAEVLGAMGIDRLRSILPDIIRTAASETKIQPHVRDGYLMLFVYLPSVFQDAFAEFVGPIIPTILKALSVETEFLRETALRAAQRIVQMFAENSLELILPELERGMVHSNWRVRHSSVQLLGDLLYQLSGLSGKGTTKTQDEDDTFGTSEAHVRLQEVMGAERHDRVLSRLYMARSDSTLVVRQSAVHVWKIIVPNTSRTLREIIPVLLRLLLASLSTSSREQQHLAARALGDVVRKLGDRVLPELIPMLGQYLDSDDVDYRRGVCTGLMEIIRSCPREQLTNYRDSLLVPVRCALCDELPEIRRAGARTFELLYGAIGGRTLDSILPDLLAQLDDLEANPYALDGLRQLLIVKSRAVMPYLIPKLIYPTLNVKIFAYLAQVSGDAVSSQLSRILPALLTTVSRLDTEPKAEEDLVRCADILVCIYDLTGIRNIFNTLVTGLAPSPSQLAAAPVPDQIGPGSPGYTLACLRLLYAYLEASFNDLDSSFEPGGTASSHERGTSESKTEEDDSSADDASSGTANSEEFNATGEDSEVDSEDETEEDDEDSVEETPDSKEVISKVMQEFYPLTLRNVCRLLAVTDQVTLTYAWRCLESMFKRWSPEHITTQINDLRQGVRGAVAEFQKITRSKAVQQLLPGFSDPQYPVTSLVKLYADCTLRGRGEIKETASQALLECIGYASSNALERSVVKVIGPLIRLLGERPTLVVRSSVVEALTTLINKCPKSARPFATQLQATFLKCLGDPYRRVRLLGAQGLSAVVQLTPKLDPLLVDLARVPAHTVLNRWPGKQLPPGVSPTFADTPSVGAAATALTLNGVASYPETSFHALRLCLAVSSGRATMDALNSVLTSLSPMAYLPESTVSGQSTADPSPEEEIEEANDVRRTQSSTVLNWDEIRLVASACLGSLITTMSCSRTGSTDSTDRNTWRLLDSMLFPSDSKKLVDHWTFHQSQAVMLLVALSHGSRLFVTEQAIAAGFGERLERLITKLCTHEKLVVSHLGLRCLGVYVGAIVTVPISNYDLKPLLQLLLKNAKHELVETRVLAANAAAHIAWQWNLTGCDPASIPHAWLDPFLNVLVAGCRDTSSLVRVAGDTAMATMCRFGANTGSQKESSSLVQMFLEKVDSSNRGFLDSCLQRLRKQNWTDMWAQGCPNLDNTINCFL